jgi:hypothetical protein
MRFATRYVRLAADFLPGAPIVTAIAIWLEFLPMRIHKQVAVS